MILDTSAVMAILQDEPGAAAVLETAAAHPCRISAGTWIELGVVADARSDRLGSRVDRVLDLLGAEIVPVTTRQAQIARTAYRRFGRGSGSRAGLNLGDTFAYALAIDTDEALLFVGDDLTHTDVRRP